MALFLGLDCGGSTTRALVQNDAGHVVFQGKSGAANLASTPLDQLTDHLKQALQDVPSVDHAVGCFAGLLTANDRERAVQVLQGVVRAEACDAFPDFHATLASFPEDTQTVAIAGTGAIVASRGEHGVVKSWGGGPVLGDEGSAYSVGRRALASVILPSRPAEASPRFWAAVQEEFGSTQPNEVLASLYRRPSQAAQLARLAPRVVADAAQGLAYAVDAVKWPLLHLAEEVLAHLKLHQSKAEIWNLGLAGGLWETDPYVKAVFLDGLAASDRVIRIREREVPSEIGAVRLARRIWNGRTAQDEPYPS